MRNRSKPQGAFAVIGWTALSIVAPRAAHLRAGWRKTGLALLSTHTALLLDLLWTALTADLGELAGRLVTSSWLTGVTVISLTLGVAECPCLRTPEPRSAHRRKPGQRAGPAGPAVRRPPGPEALAPRPRPSVDAQARA